MTITKASNNQIQKFMESHADWSIQNEKLHREYVFKDFVEAFAFMTQVAVIAEQSNHHPEWFNVYKNVAIDLTTHEAGGITERDFALAQQMERIASL